MSELSPTDTSEIEFSFQTVKNEKDSDSDDNARKNETLHKVEGPQQRVKVELSKDEYLKHCYPNVIDLAESDRWFFEEVVEAMPEGDLKTAIDVSRKEYEARLSEAREKGPSYNWYSTTPLIEGSDQYAFRGVIRRSDGGPTIMHEDSTMKNLNESIFEHGIDFLSEDSARSVNPGYTIPRFCVPNQMRVKDGENVSVIQVYKNEPYIVQLPEDETTVLLVDINNGSEYSASTKISVEEAKERELPTLRDLFIGQLVTEIK